MSRFLIALPSPRSSGRSFLETIFAYRHSMGPYAEEQLTIDQVGQLLWAAHTTSGVVREGKRTNGTTWLVFYACQADGVWRYHPQEHYLTRHLGVDVREALADAAWNRWFIAQAPCVLVISAIAKRGAEERCGERWRLYYPPIEAGRAVERTLLQAAALGLASVPVSEFDDTQARYALTLSRQEELLYLLPVGWPSVGPDGFLADEVHLQSG